MRSHRLISLVGCHAEGEVGDVIIGGVLPPPGRTMFEKMVNMERDHDHIRRFLISEPRGSVARHVNLLVPPTRDQGEEVPLLYDSYTGKPVLVAAL